MSDGVNFCSLQVKKLNEKSKTRKKEKEEKKIGWKEEEEERRDEREAWERREMGEHVANQKSIRISTERTRKFCFISHLRSYV